MWQTTTPRHTPPPPVSQRKRVVPNPREPHSRRPTSRHNCNYCGHHFTTVIGLRNPARFKNKQKSLRPWPLRKKPLESSNPQEFPTPRPGWDDGLNFLLHPDENQISGLDHLDLLLPPPLGFGWEVTTEAVPTARLPAGISPVSPGSFHEESPPQLRPDQTGRQGVDFELRDYVNGHVSTTPMRQNKERWRRKMKNRLCYGPSTSIQVSP